MVIRGTPSLRGFLEACFVLGLSSGLVISCGEPQPPSFQTKFLDSEQNLSDLQLFSRDCQLILPSSTWGLTKD